MTLLHSTLIPYRTRSLLQREQSRRKSRNYRQVRHIGLLFVMSSLHEFELIKTFEKKLRKDGKEIKVLSYLPPDIENFDFRYDFFTQKDFSFFGGVQAANIGQFLEQPFDLLICLDREPNMYIEYLIAASAASFRIGPHINQREYLFELMIQIAEERDLSELINQVYHYINKL